MLQRPERIGPSPFTDPDRLVQVFKTPVEIPDRACCVTSPPDFVDWRHDNTVFTELVASNGGTFPLAGDGPAEQIPGATVTGGFFDVLGVPAALGRTLQLADDAVGGPDVVVLGAGLWRRRHAEHKLLRCPDVVHRRRRLRVRVSHV